MKQVNKVILQGNIAKELSLKELDGGKKVLNFTIGSNESYKKGDEKLTKTAWVNVVAWDGLAETISKYCDKGSEITIEGKIQTRSYQEEGTDKDVYVTEVLASDVFFHTKSK